MRHHMLLNFQGILGLFFYLQEIHYDLSSITWVPIVTLIIYMIAYSIGWGPIPWAVMGEMFATGVKPKASSICVCAIWFFSFSTTKFFSNVENSFGAYTGFWLFSICCAVNIVFIVMLFPETKGKTLSEIQEKLNRPNNRSTVGAKIPIIQDSSKSRF